MSTPCAEAKKLFSEHETPEGLVEQTKRAFDSNYNEGNFIVGPFKEQFGNGRDEPYNPDRQAFGILKKGYGVWCEIGAKP